METNSDPAWRRLKETLARLEDVEVEIMLADQFGDSAGHLWTERQVLVWKREALRGAMSAERWGAA